MANAVRRLLRALLVALVGSTHAGMAWASPPSEEATYAYDALSRSAVRTSRAGISDRVWLRLPSQSTNLHADALAYDPPPARTTNPAVAATKPGTAISRACRTVNSFRADTEVVMADGSRKPISELTVGDEVVATDPETGLTAVRAVTAVHLNLDTALADLTVVDDDGDLSTIHTTQHHPFWNVTDHTWTDVVDLRTGGHLRSADGSLLAVVGLRAFTGRQWMWDLTVEGIHTFYVANGDEPILVHNCDPLTAAEAENLGTFD